MMVEAVTCPECGRRLLLPESYRGEKVQCPSCTALFLAGPLLPIGEAIPVAPGQPGTSPPIDATPALDVKDLAEKVQDAPRQRLPMRPASARQPIRRRAPKKRRRSWARGVGLAIIGVSFASLLVVGGVVLVTRLWVPRPHRVFVQENRQQWRQEVKQALQDQKPVNEKEIAQELKGLFDDLGAAFTAQDQVRIVSHFNTERLFDELLNQQVLPEHLRRSRAQFVAGVNRTLGPTLLQQAPLLAWARTETKNIKKLEGNEAVVIARHVNTAGLILKMRWWVTKQQGTWQIFDYEDLNIGLRATTEVGSVTALGFGEMQGVARGMAELRLALLAAVQRDPDTAERKLQQIAAVKFPPKQQALVHLVTGLVMEQRNRHGEALLAFDSAHRSNPDMPVLDLLKGIALNRLDQWDKALKHLEIYRDLLGDDSQVCLELGLALHGLNRYPEAQAAYRKSLDYNPREADAFLNLIRSLGPADRRDDLGARFARLDNPHGNFDLCADDCWQSRDYAGLEVLALAMQKIDPDYPPADHHLALVRAHAGMADQALKLFRASQVKQPDAEKRKAGLDQFLVAMAQGGHAAEAYPLAADPRAAFRLLAGEAHQAYYPDDLKRLVAAHGKKHQDDPVWPFYQGEVFVREGDFAKANKAFAAGMAHPPDHGTLDQFRNSRVLAMYRCNQGLDAYRAIRPQRATFGQLAQLCLQDDENAQLSALIDAHGRNDPADLDLLRYRFCLRIRQHRIEEGVGFFKAALARPALGPKQQELVSLFLNEMQEAGSALEGYRAVPDAKQAFPILASDLFNRHQLTDLRRLVGDHRLRHPDDVWLDYYRGQLYAGNKEWDKAAQVVKDGMIKGPANVRHSYRELFVYALYKAGRGMQAYADGVPTMDVFYQLANLLVNDKNGPELEALVAAHRPHAGEEPELLYYEIRAKIFAGQPEAARALFPAAYAKLPAHWRDNLMTNFLMDMTDAGQVLAAYRVVPDQPRAFPVAARHLLHRKKQKDLRALLDLHARNHPGDPWLEFFAGELDLLAGAARQAKQHFAAGLAKAPSNDQWTYKNGLYRAAIKSGDVVSAYREAAAGAQTFPELANLCVWEKNSSQLKALIAVHRQANPVDVQLPAWETEVKWLDHDYDAVLKLLAAHREGVFALTAYQWKYDGYLVGSLIKLKRYDDAVREAEALPKHRWNVPGLRIRAHAAQGGVKAACAEVDKLRPQAYVLQGCYRDPDLGPILRSELFREFRERFPETKIAEDEEP